MIRRRKLPELILPLTSMGDIAFLLIIFFMLASNFMKTANVQLTAARSSDLEKQDPAKINVMLDEDGTLWYQGTPCNAQELAAELKLIAETLRDAAVHVSIHRSHPRRTFMPVIEAISEAGVKMVLTGEPEDAQP